MNACISAGGASMKLLPMRRQAGERGAGVADPIQLGARRSPVSGRRAFPLRERDQRLQRDEAPDAVRVRADEDASQLARILALRPGERQPRQGRAAHVVRDIAHRAFQVGGDARRLALRQPAERARRRRAQRFAALGQRLAQQPHAGLTRVGQLADAGDRGGARGRVSAVEHRFECRQRVARAPTRPTRQQAHRLRAHGLRSIVDRAANHLEARALARARGPHRLQPHRLVAVARRLPQQAPQSGLCRRRDDQLTFGGVALNQRALQRLLRFDITLAFQLADTLRERALGVRPHRRIAVGDQLEQRRQRQRRCLGTHGAQRVGGGGADRWLRRLGQLGDDARRPLRVAGGDVGQTRGGRGADVVAVVLRGDAQVRRRGGRVLLGERAEPVRRRDARGAVAVLDRARERRQRHRGPTLAQPGQRFDQAVPHRRPHGLQRTAEDARRPGRGTPRASADADSSAARSTSGLGSLSALSTRSSPSRFR